MFDNIEYNNFDITSNSINIELGDVLEFDKIVKLSNTDLDIIEPDYFLNYDLSNNEFYITAIIYKKQGILLDDKEKEKINNICERLSNRVSNYSLNEYFSKNELDYLFTSFKENVVNQAKRDNSQTNINDFSDVVRYVTNINCELEAEEYDDM